MRRLPRPLIRIAVLALSMGLAAGCSTDYTPAIMAELATKGLAEVTLKAAPDQGDKVFSFEGKRRGATCTGTARVVVVAGAPMVDATVKCPKSAAELAEEAPVDPNAALKTSCDAGEGAACSALAVKLSTGGRGGSNPERARELFKRLCDGGDLDACVLLGALHAKGHGGARDFDAAKVLYAKACDGDLMEGCSKLANRQFVAGANMSARKTFKQACDGGSMSGCNGLGSLLKRGMGGKKDIKRAKVLFTTACEAGELGGCTNLGIMFMKGQGVAKSASRAQEYFQMACDGKQAIACAHLETLKASDTGGF